MNSYDEKAYEEAGKRIEKSRSCMPKVNCCIGITGPTGSTANSTTCFCVDQMKNIIQQIITLYPNDNLVITIESGNNVSGRPGSLLPGPNNNPTSGIFQLVNNQGTLEEAVSICRIASITITSSTYNKAITYLLQHLLDVMQTVKLQHEHTYLLVHHQ